MSAPDDGLSQTVQRYAWRGRHQYEATPEVDYEEGGIGLNDTSEGMEAALWAFTYVGAEVFVEVVGGSKFLLFAEPLSREIQGISGAFDQNMQPVAAYKSADQWHFRWFDTISSGFIFSDLPTAATSVYCTLDDKRGTQVSASDVLILYTANDNLYMLRQRDRYATPILIRAGVSGVLVRVGMNGIHRLQYKLRVV